MFHYVAQTDLELVGSSDPPVSLPVLGLQACTTLPKKTPAFFFFFLITSCTSTEVPRAGTRFFHRDVPSMD